MPSIRISTFRGYTTKRDLLNDPSYASIADDCIVNKGNLCNVSFNRQNKTWVSIVGNKLVEFYYIRDKTYTVVLYPNGTLEIAKFGYFAAAPIITKLVTSQQMVLWDKFTTTFGGVGYNNIPIHGNMLRVGEWLFILSLFGDYDESPRSLDPALTFTLAPRMLRLKSRSTVLPNNPEYLLTPVGLPPPVELAIGTESPNATTDSINGFSWGNSSWDIGVTLVTDLTGDTRSKGTNPDGRDWKSFESLDDLESNGVIMNYATVYGSNVPVIRVVIPTIYMQTFRAFPHRLGVYARRSDQSIYYFVGYTTRINGSVLLDNDITSGNNNPIPDTKYFDVTIRMPNPDFVQDLNKTIPVTGTKGPILGSHNVPLPSFHGVFFKGRMYYLTVPSMKERESTYSIGNRLQYSMRTPAGEDETGKYANYVEGEEFIGTSEERLTGGIVFLNQLVIFKENSTWLITDDIKLGEIRPLFEDQIGCVNKNGGKAYTVHNDILYWVDTKGIYAYSGSGRPQRISDPIQEDFDTIEKQRLSFCRVGVDPRYDLVIFGFPVGNKGDQTTIIKSFVYHPKEDGAWTRFSRQISNVIIERITNETTYNVYNVSEQFLELLDSIDNRRTGSAQFALNMMWRSSLLTFNTITKRNFFSRLKVNNTARNSGKGDLEDDITVRLNVYNKDDELLLTKAFVYETNRLVTINRHMDFIKVELIDGLITPFRISEVILEGYPESNY